ncbi:MAG: helix-turn-helix domain-containing protein [Actinobacteria bacterium]|nr:helix-turn-helix domain-containing protein [Actinomycetota bacterium]
MVEGKWLSSKEAADRLGVSLRTLYRLIDEGQLVGYQIGRNIRLRHADLDDFVERSRITPGDLRHLYQFDEADVRQPGPDPRSVVG